MRNGQTQITSLLCAVSNGDAGAVEQLWRLVYDELHRVAKARMGHEGRRGELQTTVLVQEAYLRLVGSDGRNVPRNRRHFFAAAANAMRQYLVDHARKRETQKRGGGRRAVDPGGAAAAGTNGPGGWEPVASLDLDPAELLALDDALARLRERDARKADIVQLRYFAGLTVDETAEVLDVSPRLVDKEWRFAKAWLHRELS